MARRRLGYQAPAPLKPRWGGVARGPATRRGLGHGTPPRYPTGWQRAEPQAGGGPLRAAGQERGCRTHPQALVLVTLHPLLFALCLLCDHRSACVTPPVTPHLVALTVAHQLRRARDAAALAAARALEAAPGPLMLLPLPAGHPALPLKRARIDGQRSERERRACGAAGLVQLGSSRAALVSGGAVLFGTFSSYTQSWFQIDLDCGGKHNCRAHEALAALLFDPADFVGRPDLFYYDFNVGNPSMVPGWTKGLVD